jgi:SAM-dependent methyltransferase
MLDTISVFRARLRRKLRLVGRQFVRAEYKRVWNAASMTEDDAKISVAGYTDEKEFSRTAQGTKTMLETLVGVGKDDVVLEIGAGVGRVGAVLAPVCRRWIGADVSENMLTHLKRRLAHLPNVEALPLNGYDLGGVADSSIDVVYCTVVFMHLDEWDRFGYVQEGFRVLRRGGRMLIDNFNLISEDGWEFFLKNRNDYAPLQRPANISKSSTPAELETYLRRAGFSGVNSTEAGLWVIATGRKS